MLDCRVSSVRYDATIGQRSLQLGDAAVLIGLLNAILRLNRPIVEVENLNPFSYQEFADDKLVVLDIRARDAAGLWLNIEMQVSVFGGLLQRLV